METAAFNALRDLLHKSRQGGDKPSAEDLATRRTVGNELAQAARAFLTNYPSAAKWDDARAFIGLGLYEATMAGDTAAGKQLADFAAKSVADPKLADMLKLHVFGLNYIATKFPQDGKGSLNQGSAIFQKAMADAFFAAAEVLPIKDDIFKMLLLQAKSGRELNQAEKNQIAERILNHPAASSQIKSEAKRVLSGERAYALGEPLNIAFTAVDGRKVDLQSMKGKVVLVDFWATWCGPCIAEIPNLKKAYDQFHDKGFEIIGISLDDKKSDLIAFTKKHDMPWPQHCDSQHWNNEFSFRFGINSVPTQWLVDKKGNLRTTEARFNLEKQVERLLNED